MIYYAVSTYTVSVTGSEEMEKQNQGGNQLTQICVCSTVSQLIY